MVWLAVTRPCSPRRIVSGGHHLEEAALRVVGLVAVQVGGPPVARRQREHRLHVALAVLPGPLEVRDAAHHVGAQLERLDHERLAVRERVDALLREGHELDRHHAPPGLPQLQERA